MTQSPTMAAQTEFTTAQPTNGPTPPGSVPGFERRVSPYSRQGSPASWSSGFRGGRSSYS